MAKPYDILLDQEDELQFSAEGDFVLDISEAQNLDHIVRTVPGTVKTEPISGVGIGMYLKKRMNLNAVYTKTKSQLKADTWINEEIQINGEDIYIRAERDEVN